MPYSSKSPASKKHKTCYDPPLFQNVSFFSYSLRQELSKRFGNELSYRTIERYSTPLQQILLDIHPSMSSSYFSTVPSLQEAMQKSDVAHALLKKHPGLHKQPLSALNRFLRILGLTVETNARGEKHLLVVEEEEEEEGEMSGSEKEEEQEEEEDTEDEEERHEKGTGRGRMEL